MPFRSKAQQRFLEAHPEKVGGREKLKEWEGATDFASLPERAGLDDGEAVRRGGTKDMASKHFMQRESEREKHAGTKGVFSAAAHRAGESTRAFAEKHKHSSGKIGRRARMALAFMSAKH